MEEVHPPPPAPTPTPWSTILQKQPQQQQKPQPQQQLEQKQENPFPHQPSGVLVGSCNSSKGISVAVVDANAVIRGGERLSHYADRFVSVDEVISEIRDPASRHSLNFLPFTVDTLEPYPDALKKVINFAKATGDLQTLSDVDLKLIALTYTLEAQIHGTQHLRESPPPIRTVNVKRLPEKELLGWGNNVPNLEEWEALEHLMDDKPNPSSRILPIKDLNLGETTDIHSADDGLSQDGSMSQIENQVEGDDSFRKPRRFSQKKREIKLDGKKMVVDGIDASQGQCDDNADDWLPAVSRSTHRRFLRRKARREMSETLSELGDKKDAACNEKNGDQDDDQCPELLVDESYEERINGNFQDAKITSNKNIEEDISASLKEIKLDELSTQGSPVQNVSFKGIESDGVEEAETAHDVASYKDVEITESHKSECDDALQMDDASSEQSWTLRSLSESTVACVTSDYAMQNVLLQMGLRLLAPGGMQIRELHRYVLKCHACFKVCTESGRIFCPCCGNGGTLRKVAVTVGENGVVLAARRPRVSLRGTKFSLPLPQGGRDAVAKNPILREDQLPQKYLYPKTKKKNKEEDDFFVPDDIFRHQFDKKASHQQPPVRRALAVFSGKRNPNDNHYARVKC